MVKPVEIHFQHMKKSEALEERIRQHAERLDRVHPNIMSCLVHVEKPHRHRSTHEGWKITVEVVVPNHGDITVSKSSDEHAPHDDAYQVVNQAFDAMARRLQKLVDRDRGHVKHHPHEEVTAVIKRLFDDHGFLHTLDGHDVYFHRNSLVGCPFEELAEGMGVTFSEEEGEMGPQATTVHVVSRQPVPLQPRRL